VGVVVVVGAVVVEVAEAGRVGEVGRAASGPRVLVVGFGPGGGGVTAFGAAVLVADPQGFALGAGEQAGGAAEVEDLTVVAEYTVRCGTLTNAIDRRRGLGGAP